MMSKIIIDRDFPGGNIIVDRIDGDDVYWRQDQSDTQAKFWFYFYAGVRGAAGRRLTFHFTAGDCLPAPGPCVSIDGGRTWRWLGRRGDDGSFAFNTEQHGREWDALGQLDH